MFVIEEYLIRGITPTVQHNGQLADPSNRYVIAMKEITKKRSKTTEDFKELEDLEWEGSLYLNSDLRVIVPGTVIVGALALSGKKSNEGQVVRSAVTSPDDWTLDYRGPRSLDQLRSDPNHRLRVSVVVPSTRSRIMRCRPIFRDWSLRFRLAFRSDIISSKDLEDIVKRLGTDIGLSDDRKMMGGRFEVVEHKKVANAA